MTPNGPWLVRPEHARESSGERSVARPSRGRRRPPPGRCPRPGAPGPDAPGPDAPGAAFRAGFACLAGRPNVGKSTLTNALVGAKVAITSDRPQTTRRVIRGIVHRPDAQLILVDTPGLHRPRTLLGEHLDSLVRSTLAEVDVIGFCIPAGDPIGPGDRFLARELENVRKTPVVVVVTKSTRCRRSGWPSSSSRFPAWGSGRTWCRSRP